MKASSSMLKKPPSADIMVPFLMGLWPAGLVIRWCAGTRSGACVALVGLAVLAGLACILAYGGQWLNTLVVSVMFAFYAWLLIAANRFLRTGTTARPQR